MSKPKTLLEPVKNRMPKPLSVNLLIGPGAPAGLPALQRRRSTELTESTSALSHSTCFCYFDETGLFASITATMKPAIKYILALLKGCGGARLGEVSAAAWGWGQGAFWPSFRVLNGPEIGLRVSLARNLSEKISADCLLLHWRSALP
jgi:hypothetical protein